MSQQWADISEADKAQCAVEAAARNGGKAKAKPSATAVPESLPDEGARCVHMIE